MQITRISNDQYVVGACNINKVDGGWEIRPMRAPHNERPIATRPTLESAFNFCEGVRRMLAPLDQEADVDF